MKKDAIAVVGAGKGGTAILETLLKMPDIVIRSVCDVDPEAPGMRLARARGIPCHAGLEPVCRDSGLDLIFEATGLSELTLRLAGYLGRNGVLVVTGVPRGPKEVRIDANSLMAQLVRTNQAIVGSVNACPGCFRRALAHLAEFKSRHPAVMPQIITSRFPPEHYQPAFAGKSRDEIKVVIEFP